MTNQTPIYLLVAILTGGLLFGCGDPVEETSQNEPPQNQNHNQNQTPQNHNQTPQCAQKEDSCDGVCVDPLRDVDHCGGCDQPCRG